MSQPVAKSVTDVCRDKRRYQCLPLVDLVLRIVNQGDVHAIWELHTYRTVFRHGHEWLSLVEFIDRLRQSAESANRAGPGTLLLDKAYDLTISKFACLPSGADSNSRGIDCRHYYQAFLDRLSELKRGGCRTADLTNEAVAARTLQQLVIRHFNLSVLEARRSANKAVSRYAWRVNGGVIYVWMPKSMKGSDKRAWLAANIKDPDPSCTDEHERVQAIVHDRLTVPLTIRLDERGRSATGAPPVDGQSLASPLAHAIAAKGLAPVVAEEKAIHIDRLRPRIRALGTKTVKQMILQIFDRIRAGEPYDGPVARQFGLSKSTFSRFAGSLWRRNPDTPIPDLWVNTAQVLAHHAAFREAVRESGLWPRIQATAAGRHADGEHNP